MLTPAEFEIMQKAQRLKEVDLDHRIHELAYLTFVASQRKPAGKGKEKAAYPTFKKFYDYQKELKKVSGYQEEEISPHIRAVMRAKENVRD